MPPTLRLLLLALLLSPVGLLFWVQIVGSGWLTTADCGWERGLGCSSPRAIRRAAESQTQQPSL